MRTSGLRNTPNPGGSPDRLVATKLVLHGNIPGSYEFNRHRRCRWDIAYLEDPAPDPGPVRREPWPWLVGVGVLGVMVVVLLRSLRPR